MAGKVLPHNSVPKDTRVRLWTLHPKYLDPRGLVALWREALLAQAVLRGQTRGYVHHPQLRRFRETPAPVGAIASFLRNVHAESVLRGYSFDREKISRRKYDGTIVVTRGQLDYEWERLKAKLQARAPKWLAEIESVSKPEPNPLFLILPGRVAEWEVLPP